MKDKNYAEVLINGKIYTLGGSEEELYLQKVAAYINDKIAQLKKQPGYLRQSSEDQSIIIQLNLADDFFKADGLAEELRELNHGLEKENYSLKHELITLQMKLESVLRELEDLKPKKNVPGK